MPGRIIWTTKLNEIIQIPTFSTHLIVIGSSKTVVIDVLVRGAPERRESARVSLLLATLWRAATSTILPPSSFRRAIGILENQQRAICQLQRVGGLLTHFKTLGTSPCPTSHLLQPGHWSLHWAILFDNPTTFSSPRPTLTCLPLPPSSPRPPPTPPTPPPTTRLPTSSAPPNLATSESRRTPAGLPLGASVMFFQFAITCDITDYCFFVVKNHQLFNVINQINCENRCSLFLSQCKSFHSQLGQLPWGHKSQAVKFYIHITPSCKASMTLWQKFEEDKIENEENLNIVMVPSRNFWHRNFILEWFPFFVFKFSVSLHF